MYKRQTGTRAPPHRGELHDDAGDDSDVQTATRQLHEITATGGRVPVNGCGSHCTPSEGKGGASAPHLDSGSAAFRGNQAAGSCSRASGEQHRRLLAAAAFCSGDGCVERCGAQPLREGNPSAPCRLTAAPESGPPAPVPTEQLSSGAGHGEHRRDKAPPSKRPCTSSEKAPAGS